MRVVYFGTSAFAVPPLEALLSDGGVDVPLVVTQPDRVRGRGGKVLPTPVKAAALARMRDNGKSGRDGLRVLEPERIRGNEAFFAELAAAAPDLIVVASYGQILPREVLELPRLGCVNIHASLLPKYRGASPIRQAILDGEEETGVTLMVMGEGLDDGDMIARTAARVGDLDAGALTERLAAAGAALLLEALPSLEDGTALRVPQEESLATYAPKTTKEDARLDWSAPAEAVVRRVRAMAPEPGAWTLAGDVRVRVLGAHIGERAAAQGNPGTVFAVSDEGVFVLAGDGAVVLDVIGVPGKRPMRVAEFLRGNAFPAGRLE
ncbi:MAG: methionyl-tRNA formyltransferase [Clostridiales Family XIII bacterium]|jgi:methionyl-tRNA formyltransferase|nr:methionyl-tRNA formyltransferase [Clostridiales Family XIII bacterium]